MYNSSIYQQKPGVPSTRRGLGLVGVEIGTSMSCMRVSCELVPEWSDYVEIVRRPIIAWRLLHDIHQPGDARDALLSPENMEKA